MSVLHPSRVTRRLLKIASLGLAGLLAGLLTGCSSASAHLLPRNDTDWQTSSTYASATASLPPRDAIRSTHTPRPCYAAPCELRPQTAHTQHLRHL